MVQVTPLRRTLVYSPWSGRSSSSSNSNVKEVVYLCFSLLGKEMVQVTPLSVFSLIWMRQLP